MNLEAINPKSSDITMLFLVNHMVDYIKLRLVRGLFYIRVI